MLVEKLARQAQVSEDWLLYIAATASERYKLYDIPKRDGGTRLIEHPSRDLKAVQRWLSNEVLSPLPVHNCAMAYKAGSSIRENAKRHAETRYTVRYDFKSFFPSFSAPRIREFLKFCVAKNQLSLNDDDIHFFQQCVTRKGRLTIGAPSSPALTNAMMFEFDLRMYQLCADTGRVYTRYADDIFVSSFSKDNLTAVDSEILSARAGISYLSLRLNRSKTVHMSMKRRRQITGLTVTSRNEVSLGRDRKREIKSLVHKYLVGSLKPEEIGRLRGLLAFVNDIEPSFRLALERKYGHFELSKLLGSAITPLPPPATPSPHP